MSRTLALAAYCMHICIIYALFCVSIFIYLLHINSSEAWHNCYCRDRYNKEIPLFLTDMFVVMLVLKRKEQWWRTILI